MSPSGNEEAAELRRQMMTLEDEVVTLRRRLQDAPRRVQDLEARLAESHEKLARSLAQNDKLATVLEEARRAAIACFGPRSTNSLRHPTISAQLLRSTTTERSTS